MPISRCCPPISSLVLARSLGGLDGCCLGGVPPLPLVIGSDSSPARLIAAFFIGAGQIWGEDVDTIRLDGSDRLIGPSPELGRTTTTWRRWSTENPVLRRCTYN
ncbi:hypothetical protein ACLOJK_014774, partial [Asimina triloba]